MKISNKIISAFLSLILIFSLGGCYKNSDTEIKAPVSSFAPETDIPSEPDALITTERPESETPPIDNTEPEPEPETDPESTPEAEPEPTPLDKNKTYEVLFIGNSCTSKNDLDFLFKMIAESAGYNVNTTRVVKGGWYLDGHADPTDEAGAKVAEQLAAKKWDFVVFQDQVRGFFQAQERVRNGITAITEKVRENGAEPVLYVTWSYADGHSYMDQKDLTYDSMSWGIISQCQAIASELDIKVAYAGYAMREFYLNLSEGESVYDPDKVHSSLLGSYISALTIFSKIFNVDPVDVTHYKGYFKRHASPGIEYIRAAVYERFEIPDEYKIK